MFFYPNPRSISALRKRNQNWRTLRARSINCESPRIIKAKEAGTTGKLPAKEQTLMPTKRQKQA